MSPDDAMRRIDSLLTHVWMVRTFVKHSEEAEEDEELQQVHRGLYDYLLALGSAWKAQDAAAYLKQARKKYARLQRTTEDFARLQPEVSIHTNFEMAVASLTAAVKEVGELLDAQEG